MASWGNWNETLNEKIDNKTDSWDDKVGGVIDKWETNVNDTVGQASNFISEELNSATAKLNNEIMQGFADVGIEGGMKPIEVDKVYDGMQVRDKLVVNCPNFMKQFGASKIDFGRMFLSDAGEKLIATGQTITNNVLDTLGGIHQYITPEIVTAVTELLNYVIQDLTKTILDLAQNTFLSYATPEYPASLAKMLAEKTRTYTKNNIISPADLLNELNTKTEDISQKINDEELNKLKDIVTGKTSGALGELTKKTQKVLSEILKYSSVIAEYAKFGPDYAITQVLQIYRKYLNIGLSYVYNAKAQLDSLIYRYVDFAAAKSGQFSANLINQAQRKSLQKAINLTNKVKQQAKLKALALVNKAIMSLLAQLGG